MITGIRYHPTASHSAKPRSMRDGSFPQFVRSVFVVPVLIAVSGAWAQTPVRMVHIDGTTLRAEWLGTDGGALINVRTDDGVQALPLDDFSTLTFNGVKPRKWPPPMEPKSDDQSETAEGGPAPEKRSTPSYVPAVFYLADGGRINGELLASDSALGDALLTRTALSANGAIPFSLLAGVRLASPGDSSRAEEVFAAALANRLPGEDVFITREADAPKSLRGRLESMDAAAGAFYFGQRSRSFQTDKTYGVVFAAGARRREQQDLFVTVTLVDGSSVSGQLQAANATSLRFAFSVGLTGDLSVADVANLDVHSTRVVFVSGLKPTSQRVEGMLHRPWPVQTDRSVSGGTLSINGRRFERGLGVHSRTELTYAIDGAYEKLAATIGIDDAVRPSGSAIFRVLGDAKVLFDSGEVVGSDPPRDIVVDVRGVRELTLLVDYGAELDLADHGDWGGVRLLKPRKNRIDP